MLTKIHEAMTPPLMIVWPTSPCGQAIAKLDSPYKMKLALCRTDPQKMMTPMPHLHAGDAPFRMAWLWRGIGERACVKIVGELATPRTGTAYRKDSREQECEVDYHYFLERLKQSKKEVQQLRHRSEADPLRGDADGRQYLAI